MTINSEPTPAVTVLVRLPNGLMLVRHAADGRTEWLTPRPPWRPVQPVQLFATRKEN